MNKIALTFCLVLISLVVFSQNKDSLNVINRKYRNEIDVALQLFGSPGAAFIYKLKDNSGRFIELNSAKNYRFQAGLTGNFPVTQKTTLVDTATTSIRNVASRNAKAYGIQAMFGKEKVKFFGKFNLYYGCDFGLYYTYSATGYDVIESDNGNGGFWYTYYGYYPNGGSFYAPTNYNYSSPYYYNVNLPNEINEFGFSFAPFIGAKYRFSEHLSASIETAFYLNYFISQTRYTYLPLVYPSNFAGKTVLTKKSSGFEFSPKYLRFLTLNYHF